MESEFVTMKEAREMLGVSGVTIWRLVKEGRLHAYQSGIDRRRKLVKREDVERLRQIVPLRQTKRPQPEG